MKKRLIAVIAIALVTGCADVRFYAAGYADMAIHPSNPKVLTVRIDRQCGQRLEWVRTKDMKDLVLVCDAGCNCKLVKSRPPRPAGMGICR